jgi:hypothetical protein
MFFAMVWQIAQALAAFTGLDFGTCFEWAIEIVESFGL